MHTTSISLLQRLRARDDFEAWDRFVQLYTPMIYRWGVRTGLSSEAAGELVQEVLALLVRKLPEFRYRQKGSFRGWLRRVTINRYRELNRRQRVTTVPMVEYDPIDRNSVEPAVFVEEGEYRAELVNRAMHLIKTDCDEQTWEAFWQYVAVGHSPAEVADKLEISVNSVYLAKSRVLKRLRDELDGLL